MYPDKPDNSKQKAVAGLVVLIVIGLLAVGVVVYNGQQNQTTVSTTSSVAPSSSPAAQATSDTTTQTSSSSSTSSGYKDGTFTASSDYYVPHGSESINVTLTVKNGVVTDSSIQNSENDGESAQYQEQFASEYKSQVVGKPISSLSLNYVAGASDTTQGFNDALNQIRSQAQA